MLHNPLLFLNNDRTCFIESVGRLAGSKLFYNQLLEATKLRNFNMCDLQCQKRKFLYITRHEGTNGGRGVQL